MAGKRGGHSKKLLVRVLKVNRKHSFSLAIVALEEMALEEMIRNG